MVNINLFGTVFGQTGYDSHTKQLVNALYKQNPSIHLQTQLPADYLRKCTSGELSMLQTPQFYNATDIAIALPPSFSECLSQKPKNFIGWVVWEGVQVPKYWEPYLKDSRISALVVPSSHTLKAIMNTFPDIKKSVFTIIPHGVDSKLFTPNPSIRKQKDGFRFIANKGWAMGANDRGGIQFLVKAFTEEFKPDKDPNVKLTIKINMVYNQPGWNLAQELEKIGVYPDDAKNVEFIIEQTDYRNMPNLYNMGDVFVSPTMGEAFNLPCLEAMACGLPVITTNFGGQTDFVNDKNGWLIDYNLIPVTWDLQYEGNSWAVPDMLQLKKTMRWCVNNQEKVKAKGVKARAMAETMSWDSSASKLLHLISSFEN